ncbi:hypothetical protein, partial [Catenulispora rubra]|uniref:hypothetical protein n=1 Tax=Catenulispora rubra TaxID=280293 RepID=UPI001E4C24E1
MASRGGAVRLCHAAGVGGWPVSLCTTARRLGWWRVWCWRAVVFVFKGASGGACAASGLGSEGWGSR